MAIDTAFVTAMLGAIQLKGTAPNQKVDQNATLKNADFKKKVDALKAAKVADVKAAIAAESAAGKPLDETGKTGLDLAKIQFVKGVMVDSLYNTALSFGGTFKVFSGGEADRGTEITVGRREDSYSRIGLIKQQGETPKIKLSDVAHSFKLGETIENKLEGAAVDIDEFFYDTSTKEYAVGVTLTDFTKVLDAFGLESVTNVIELTQGQFYMAKQLRKDELPAPKPE
jgi:hypothetical protein